MQLLLRWVVAQAFGFLGFFFGGIRDGYRSAEKVAFGWDTTILFADKLFWFGITTSGFAVFDFVRRASSASEQRRCTGPAFAWLMTFNALLLCFFALSYGMVLMADTKTVVDRVSLPLVNGYGVVLVASVATSLVYVLSIDLQR